VGNSSILFFAMELSGGATVLPSWYVLCRLQPGPHTLLSAIGGGDAYRGCTVCHRLVHPDSCLRLFSTLRNDLCKTEVLAIVLQVLLDTQV